MHPSGCTARCCPREEQVEAPLPRGPAWAAVAGGCGPWGVEAPTRTHWLAWPLEPVGPCLYLVTLGGFASSTGIWHPRWKISLVRSPWKQAEPLRRFTLNGARPACIRCPVCLEFPPRLFRPLCRPGVSLLEGPRASATGCTGASATGCIAQHSAPLGLSPPPLPLAWPRHRLVWAPDCWSALGQREGLEPSARVVSGPRPSS